MKIECAESKFIKRAGITLLLNGTNLHVIVFPLKLIVKKEVVSDNFQWNMFNLSFTFYK